MSPYKCKNAQTAQHLRLYWAAAYGVECTVKHTEGWSEVIPVRLEQYAQGHSGTAIEVWRNICDAFVAGRTSMAE